MPDFTRRHYDAIAAVLGEAKSVAHQIVDTQAAVDYVSGGLAELFQQDNPQFDRARFMEACGVHW